MAVTLDQIRKVVREEVESEVNSAKHNLQGHLLRLETQVRTVGERAKNTEILARASERKLTRLDAKIDKNHKEIKEEIKNVSDFLNRGNLETLKRVKRLEGQIKPPSVN